MNKEISFWSFLSKYSVEIPIIQRDYVQGRTEKVLLRNRFLTDIKNALENNEKMLLDFVYGATNSKTMNPLDGQQRLTTLWLMHWYISLRASKLKKESSILKKFTYQTRVSSREFCSNLCNPENFKSFDAKKKV